MKNSQLCRSGHKSKKWKEKKLWSLEDFDTVKFWLKMQIFEFFMSIFEWSFGLKSKSWQHESCRLEFSLHFSFKNHLKWLSVEKDMMIRILSWKLNFCLAQGKARALGSHFIKHVVGAHSSSLFYVKYSLFWKMSNIKDQALNVRNNFALESFSKFSLHFEM